MALSAPVRLTASEYLAWEVKQAGKHEFVAGETYAMVGVTRKHATVAGNVFSLLRAHLAAGPCRVYMADMKLQIEAASAFYYPDVFVTCDARDHQANEFMSSAVLVIEVLSPSTAAYDRGEKFAAYRRLPSLREYLLIDPDRKRLECFRRDEGGFWVLHEPDAAEALLLSSVAMRLSVAEAFQLVD